MDKQIGIWLDRNKAILVKPSENKEEFRIIESEIEDYNIHGGSGSSTPYGPQDAVSESKLLERRKQQEKAYFKKIIPELVRASSIAVFGPAEMKTELVKELQKHPEYKDQVVAVETADSMTDNQVIALVRDHFQK